VHEIIGAQRAGGNAMFTRMTLFLTILLIPLATNLALGNWELYFETQSSRNKPYKKYYYDRSSIKEVEPNVYDVQHKKTSGDDDGIYTISQYWFDCTRRKMATGESVTYMQSGKEFLRGNYFNMGFYELRGPIQGITTEPYDPPWELMRIICNR